nr:MFS transporter [Pseudomonas sp. RIT-PI-AD]
MIAAAILTGLNLRPSMAAIGPLLGPIRRELGFDYSTAALLTLLPVTTIGLAMFVGLGIARRVGERRSLLAALLAIGLASALRLFTQGILDLLLSAALAGLGIALAQALLPALLKARCGERVALAMGLYVTAIMAGAALAASLAPSLAELAGGWRGALGCAALLVLPALAGWLMLPRQALHLPAVDAGLGQLRYWRHGRSWLLALYFGLGTASYTCVLAWLAPFYVELGWAPQRAGLLLGFLTTMEVVSGLVAPTIANRSRDRRPVLVGLLLLLCGGLVGLVWAPLQSPWIWAALLGLGIGGLFPLSLIVCLDHRDDPRQAGGLAAWVQGVGYLIAGLSPWLAGLLRDALGHFSSAWLALAGLMLLLIGLSLCFDPVRYPRLFREAAPRERPRPC